MSTPETKIINLFWFLMNDAELMDKLCALSKKGWHLVGYKNPNYLKFWKGYGFLFEKGDAEDRVYRSDYRPGSKAKIKDYIDLCEEAGWKNVFSKQGFFIFSAPADQASHADFFSDHSSKIAKLKRLRLRLMIPAIIFTPILFYSYSFMQALFGIELSTHPIMFTAFVLFFVYHIIQLSLRIKRLQHSKFETPMKIDPKTNKQRMIRALNIIVILTLILMPISAYFMLPDWSWSLRWHFALGVGSLPGYVIFRICIAWYAKPQLLP